MSVLVDSNIIIYAMNPAYSFLIPWIESTVPAVSAISSLETLGFHKLSSTEKDILEDFFTGAQVLAIDEKVLPRAIQLRQIRKLGLADSIIAATALVHDLVLVTRNTKDFTWIDGLKLLDPFVDLRTE